MESTHAMRAQRENRMGNKRFASLALRNLEAGVASRLHQNGPAGELRRGFILQEKETQ